jgi:enoyl-CoA hydratase
MAIRYARDGHIVTVTIDRPEAKNALDPDHFAELASAWIRFRDEADAWVAIITGNGDAFCAGADLKTLAAGRVPAREDIVVALLRSFPLYKPIIAAVNGVCAAGGMEMLGGVDIRIATPEARFGVLEPKRGLMAGGGTTVRLPRQIAYPFAMEFLLTAELIDAERALQMGLINAIVPRHGLMDAAMDYARRITANAPLSVFATKQSVLEGLALDWNRALDNEQEIARKLLETADSREGPRAFAEKRAPAWQAR